MNAEKWKVVEQLFEIALSQPAERRAQFLREACPADQELREEVLSLLHSDDSASSFLEDSPAASIDRHPELARGDKLGHFEVLELIGRSGMGLVYKAQDTNLPRFAALKFLPEHLAEDNDVLERFKREAYAASALNHPNICTVYELGEHEGHPFIAMELLEGETLRERIYARLNNTIGKDQGAHRELPLQIDELLALAIQMAEGLEAAHDKGITHRDIKPANLFLTRQGQLKILDFGIAKFQTAERPKSLTPETAGAQTLATSMDETLTLAGALIGTVAYMSPEQLSGMEPDMRTDVFSCGAVLYEMATGVAPFQRETRALIRDAILNEQPPSPARVNPHVPAELDRIIVKALAKNRQWRYQRAADLLADLRRLREAQPRRAMRAPVLLIASVTLVVTAAGFWFSLRGHPETSTGVVERQITANPPENWVSGGAVSPDGKTIAYHDQTGLYFRSVDTGEIRPAFLSPSFADRMVFFSWFPDGKRLLAPIFDEASYLWEPDMWTISTAGEAAPRLLSRNFLEGSVSPDGRSIVFLSIRGLSISDANGGPQRTLRARSEGEWIFSPAWSPDGRWIAYSYAWMEAGTIRALLLSSLPPGDPPRLSYPREACRQPTPSVTWGSPAHA